MREVLAQLGLEEDHELDVAKARLGLRLADPQAAAVEIEPGARRAHQLRDARAREAERREQRAAPVLLVRRQLGLPLAGDLEEVDDLVGSRNVRRDLATFMRRAASARGVRVEHAVLDGVIEDLREDVERHVDRPRRQPRPCSF